MDEPRSPQLICDEANDGGSHVAVLNFVENVVTCAGELDEPQRVDLFGVGAHRADGRDHVVAAVHGERWNGQSGQLGTEAVPPAVELAD